MNLYVHGDSPISMIGWFGKRLKEMFVKHGATACGSEQEDLDLVVNLLDPKRPRPFRRKGQGTFVIGIAAGSAQSGDILRRTYPFLIRSLSNMLIFLVHPDHENAKRPHEVWFVTPEQGHYALAYSEAAPMNDAAVTNGIPKGARTPAPADGADDPFFEAVYQRVAPVATARLVIDNIFDEDLEPALHQGDEVTSSLRHAGKKLDQLDLLPAPFPLEDYLPPREIAHIQRLYRMGGLSYGNLSARKDKTRFWMSASGVDKSNLAEVGRDLLLVKGYDPQHNAMRLSVPPGIAPRRVSVDAIEHWMIYTQNPGVGAIVHVHAWMDDVRSTEINYPCGSYELGASVSQLVQEAPDPNRAVIGLKNHGLTITGIDLDDIFDRIEGRILPQVPMTS